MKKTLAGLAMGNVLFLPSLAFAHTGHGSIAEGFLHPFTGIDHIFALLALGILASQVKIGRAIPIVSVFLAAFVAMLWVAQTGLRLPGQEPMLAASLIGLGALILCGNRLPFPAVLAVTAVFASYHGAAHGLELNAIAFKAALPGFLIACLLLTGGSYALGRIIAAYTGIASLRYGEAAAAVSMFTGLLLLTSS